MPLGADVKAMGQRQHCNADDRHDGFVAAFVKRHGKAHAGDSEHNFHGNVRVEHVGSGMGIEFTGQGEEHYKRIAALIEDLSKNGDKMPEVRVALAPPEKVAAQPKGKPSGTVQYDSLLALILVGGALRRSDFLRELEKQRRHG